MDEAGKTASAIKRYRIPKKPRVMPKDTPQEEWVKFLQERTTEDFAVALIGVNATTRDKFLANL